MAIPVKPNISATAPKPTKIYEGDGDRLVEVPVAGPKVTILPSGDPRTAEATRHIRVMWGQHLLELHPIRAAPHRCNRCLRFQGLHHLEVQMVCKC